MDFYCITVCNKFNRQSKTQKKKETNKRTKKNTDRKTINNVYESRFGTIASIIKCD